VHTAPLETKAALTRAQENNSKQAAPVGEDASQAAMALAKVSSVW
jgi:hypothetical protein